MDPTTFRLSSGATSTEPLLTSEVIYSFTASNNPAYGTQNAVLNWSVHSSFIVTLNNSIGVVSNSGSLSVRHGTDTTISYTLTATLNQLTYTSSLNVRFGYCVYTEGCSEPGGFDARGNCREGERITIATCYY